MNISCLLCPQNVYVSQSFLINEKVHVTLNNITWTYINLHDPPHLMLYLEERTSSSDICFSLKYHRKTAFDQSLGPAATSALPASLVSYFLKFLMNLPARSFAFSSHSEASAYVSLGSRISVLTPGSSVGTSKSK